MADRDETEVLRRLREEGATRLETVRYRRNRSTIWSLTAGGTVLNLHEAYRRAPWPVVRAFAVIARVALARDRGNRAEYARAARHVRRWPGLEPALRRIRAEHRRRKPRRRARGGGRGALRPGPCCASPAQREYLRALYLHLNRTRFGGCLPANLPLRLSSRMKRRLGQMRGQVLDGGRTVVEIALNEDLMLEGNGGERVDTLLHEMAHAADWLTEGGRGHGTSWKSWARRVGCVDRACTHAEIRRRSDRRQRVTRVPPLPESGGRDAA